ncbi:MULTISPECIES: amino acid ABC transporter permease [Aneurinibacillus]|uniref:Amino acid ABC transporter membrane protein, PAAT family n=1 Tax=Aneurinibacillus thermoaerophilus TaxID=143495 RepID=A0A1G8D054_ANETH|nr:MULTISPECIES: amino acid ABC transporter permease [Aneurinibacillus]AMA72280.1 cystine transporter permease [Aneurinibacillus sp. XH2]MED0674871.1 amino acid ABC transporter permease [Aneurinibacillus thermoaerophilus]MED0679821.1 amino acid ABC transporter permease [Aneurinibacillus thermoaerophilus]MED0735853.1 amino acid ABC transporter permease [Aneurinibacillus thermoaerophilus]MED0758477.1 amino acid ABC transporter permease [Aneurinibacillus thermoaerophilus]
MGDFINNIAQIFQVHGLAFLKASWVTIEITAVSLVFATIIGLVFAFFKISSSKLLQRIADVYITLIRGTPLIVQLMFLYYGISSIVTLSDFTAGALALGIHSGAYIAEIFRGAIQSIDRGQMEAARSLGMPYALAMRRIIFPQALKRAIPPLGNQFIIGLKDSSLVAYIAVTELFNTALSAQGENYMPFETYFVVGIYYLVLVLIFTIILNKVEEKLDVGKGKSKRAQREVRAA